MKIVVIYRSGLVVTKLDDDVANFGPLDLNLDNSSSAIFQIQIFVGECLVFSASHWHTSEPSF